MYDVYIRQLLEKENLNNCMDNFLDLYRKTGGQLPVFLYGAGNGMSWYYRILNKYSIPIVGVIDGKISGGECVQKEGYCLYSFEKICREYERAIIVISAPAYRKEIYDYVKKMNNQFDIVVFDPVLDMIQGNEWKERRKYFLDKILELEKLREILNDDLSKKTLDKYIEGSLTNSCECYCEISNKTQYFPDVIKKYLSNNEVFADVGAYTGDTIQEFVEVTSNKYRKILAFEPDIHNYQKAQEEISDNRIELYRKGVGSKGGNLFFQNGTGKLDAGAHVITNKNDASSEIEVVCLDSFMEERITYIKMDIEGMELEALRGAERIISEQKPKLAICIYHKTEDIIEIPKFILKLNPKYKLYLRHYWECNSSDTVLFAIEEK